MAKINVYKNLYYDDEERCYMFLDENNRSLIVEQQSYLLIYIIELLKEMKEVKVWNLSNAK
jgi:hypothetical protein